MVVVPGLEFLLRAPAIVLGSIADGYGCVVNNGYCLRSTIYHHDIMRHLPSSGHSFIFLQLQGGVVVWLILLSRSFLLCDEMMDLTLGMQQQLIFTLFLFDDFVETVVW